MLGQINRTHPIWTRMKIEKITSRASETCVTKQQQQKANIHMIKVREGEKREV